MNDPYENKSKARDAALDGCGIGADVQTKFRDGHKAIAAFAAAFVEKASGQLTYNLLTNAPCGVDISGDATQRAVEHGAVMAITALIQWDVLAARRLAAELLEVVNDHENAAMMQ